MTTIQDDMKRDYPLLWEKAGQYDFAERLGGCTDPLLREIDDAMREIFSARTFISDFTASHQGQER